jgi:coenzyme F420-0:L-glutamate ligase
MELLALQTRRLQPGDDLAATLRESAAIRAGDILVVSSKAIATVEGRVIDLHSMKPGAEAVKWASACGRSAEFCEAVRMELERLRGRVVGSAPGALLTEAQPEGLSEGTILTANAGLDESNVPEGRAVGWPEDPVLSVRHLRAKLADIGDIGLIVSDSVCIPRRLGVIAIALVASGFDPITTQRGRRDLFGKPLAITDEAVADQLATAANAVMGNAAQSVPAVLIRNHGIEPSKFEGWVPGIVASQDLFRGVMNP